MLRSANAILGHHLHATDGDIGKVHDLYFDDATWTVRYLAVDTGTWLPGRRVLISPASASQPDWTNKTVPVSLSKQAIKDSPPAWTHEPVSVQHEREMAHYFGWTPYWTTLDGTWGGGVGLPITPGEAGELAKTGDVTETKPEETTPEEHEGPSLRSVREVTGYHLRATDGDVGHVEDFLVELGEAGEQWVLRYLVVDTHRWLPGRKVLLALAWIRDVDWYEKHVVAGLDVETIKNAPAYDPGETVSRDYEIRLHDYYGRPAYWA
jgi:hypothetical protein